MNLARVSLQNTVRDEARPSPVKQEIRFKLPQMELKGSKVFQRMDMNWDHDPGSVGIPAGEGWASVQARRQDAGAPRENRFAGGGLPQVRNSASLLLFTVFLMACAEAADWDLEIEDFAYIPNRLVVSVGDQATWTSRGFNHTVTSDTDIFNSQTIWDYMPFGAQFSYTFTEEGVFPYFCQGHGGPGGSGMSGVITVVASTAINSRPATPTNISPADGAPNQAIALTLTASPFKDSDAGDFHSASHWIVRSAVDGQGVVDSGESKTNLTSFRPSGLSEDTTYIWQVRYKDGQGGWSDLSGATRFTTLKAVAQVGLGLRGSYYNDYRGTYFSGAPLAVATNASIDFRWGQARPHRRVTADGFGVRWEGAVLPALTEKHEFQLQTRGGVRLWVDGKLLIDEWNVCSFFRTWRGWLDLIGGQAVPIRIEYAAEPSDALLTLRWASPSQPVAPIPASRLFPPGTLPGL